MTKSTLTTSLLLTLSILLAPAAQSQEPKLKDMIESNAKSDTDRASAATDPAPHATVPAAPAAPTGPADDFERGVPRTSVMGFLEAADEKDWERAAEYLDLRNLPEHMQPIDGAELARRLEFVFDRELWIDPAALSQDPAGHADDGLPSYRDRLGVIETSDGNVEVLIQRVPREDGVRIWKFSNHTVKDVPLLWETFGYGEMAEILVDWLPEGRLFGLALWQWVTLVVLIVGSLILSWLVTYIPVRMLRKRDSGIALEAAALIAGPVWLLMTLFIVRQEVDLLAPSLAFRAVISTQTLPILLIAWMVFRAADLGYDALFRRFDRNQASAVVFIRPLRTVTRAVVVLVAALVWLDNVGFNVGTLLTGLGIGGVAVALASQKSLEDVFGAITLYSGGPVRVGDFCRFGSRTGTVEEIGLRWTRVRTLDDTVVNVSNSVFSKENLENYAERRKIWFHPRLRLRYDTTPEQIRFILVESRKLLYSHPRVLEEDARVRFVGLGDYSLDLDVFAYVNTTVYAESLEISEDLTLQLMELVTRAGAAFALPSQAYIEPGIGRDAERATAAEGSVAEWRERNELYLPSYPAEKISELRGALPYPPPGSPG